MFPHQLCRNKEIPLFRLAVAISISPRVPLDQIVISPPSLSTKSYKVWRPLFSDVSVDIRNVEFPIVEIAPPSIIVYRRFVYLFIDPVEIMFDVFPHFR